MNSLNILQNIGTPPPSPQRSRASSESNVLNPQPRPGTNLGDTNDAGDNGITFSEKEGKMGAAGDNGYSATDTPASDEKTPLLQATEPFSEATVSKAWLIPKRISGAFLGVIAIIFSPVVATGQYVIACFTNDNGQYSVFAPIYNMSRPFKRKKKTTPQAYTALEASGGSEKGKKKGGKKLIVSQTQSRRTTRRFPSTESIASTSTAISTDSEMDSERPATRDDGPDTPSRHTRSRSMVSSSGEEIAPAKRSIRIKLHNEEALRQRKVKKQPSRSGKASDQVPVEAAAALKSPTSPASSSTKLTKFPRAPQPPRPLVPRRQPSYLAPTAASAVGPHQKTLIIDLDETLIHSMVRGGRFTTGHMVEVKLQQPMGVGGAMIGPQVPILYYVHKRPYCDEFLKKVCKWYNLIVFTASVQEYADPVIDWLEVERKYFVGRYYRQHCTYRNGAYIKDLAQVEPDLSKVMIIDNSPMSYIFHEDNAIPIEGWISDPTDNDLLHLIPMLEGLQYVTDVRALLALRLGEPQSA